MSDQTTEAPAGAEDDQLEIRGDVSALNQAHLPKQERSTETLNIIADSIREVLKTKSRDSFKMSDITNEMAKRGRSVGTLYRYIDRFHPTKDSREQVLDFVWGSRRDGDYLSSMERLRKKEEKRAKKAAKKEQEKALAEQASLESPS